MKTREEILALFTKEDKKILNEAKQIMGNIYTKIDVESSYENRLANYLQHCLYDAIVAIEDIEAETDERRVTTKMI